jgi:hypothetical protein
MLLSKLGSVEVASRYEILYFLAKSSASSTDTALNCALSNLFPTSKIGRFYSIAFFLIYSNQ